MGLDIWSIWASYSVAFGGVMQLCVSQFSVGLAPNPSNPLRGPDFPQIIGYRLIFFKNGPSCVWGQ